MERSGGKDAAAANKSGVLRCDVCQTTMQPTSWTQHLVGKKHLQMMALQRTRKKSGESKVFVAGFRRGTSESALAAYFSNYATVTDVYVDKDNGSFAFVQLEDQSSVDRICSTIHSLDGQSLLVEPSRFKPKPKAQIRQKPVTLPETDELESSVKKQMSKLENVDAQMRHLAQHMGFDDTDYALREELRASLEKLFREFFPECSLTPYGSSANNYGQKGSSDLDLCLDFAFEPPDDEPSTSEQFMKRGRIIKNLNQFRNKQDPSFLTAVRNLNRTSLVRLVGAIVQKYAPGFKEVFSLTKARCPIVHCVHSKSGLKCDFSMTNRLALFNTELLLVYQRLDPRVHPLIFLIRFWGKKAGLVFSNMARLSSYAISMMVVFYLQNTVPPVLPTVEHMQSLAEETREVGGWPCHFCRDPHKFATTNNSENLESLLKGFLKFYIEINFDSTVLCVRTGKMVQLDKFLMETAELDQSKFKKSMHIQDPFELVHNIAQSASKECVTNIVARFEKTHESMTSTTSGFSKEKADKKSVSWGLVALLNEACEPALDARNKKQSKVPVRPSAPSTTTAAISKPVTATTETGEFHVTLSDNVVHLAMRCQKSTSAITQDERNALLFRLASKIRQVFDTALKFDCQDVEFGTDCSTSLTIGGGGGTKKRKSDNELATSPSKVIIVQQQQCAAVKVHGRDHTLKTFRCNVRYPTWATRKWARSELVKTIKGGSLKSIEMEAAISDHIMATGGVQAGSDNIGTPILTFVCTLCPLQKGSPSNNIGLTVKLSANTDSKQFKGMVVPFLSSYVQKIINHTFLTG